MMQQYMKELEQDPFNPEEFVERLAYRTIVETKVDNDDDFNPLLLHDSFVQAIKDLTLLQDRQQKKCERLEMIVREDENLFRREVHGLQDHNKLAQQTFRGLDEKINHVATKVLHLGDQLDSVNGPRARVVEAQRLLTHLNGFLVNETSPIFLDSSRLDETADIIQKLHIIAKDLPDLEFQHVKKKIERTYDDTEKALINEFAAAQRRDDFNRMKEIANVLFLFKGYSQCVDAYIEQSQAGCLLVPNVFVHLQLLCEKNFEIIQQVFSNFDQVRSKFVLNIYHMKLQEYINERLSKKMDTLTYLQTLFDLYSKTNQLSNGLSKFDIGSDKQFLNKLTVNIFTKCTDNYIAIEMKCLKERCTQHLQKYYESKKHQKKAIQSGGFKDIKRDIQAVIGTRANITIGQVENYGGETFLSDELAITILQDTKHAFQRCELLSKPDERSSNATQILHRLINSLLTEHVDYALELGLQAVPVFEGVKSPPKLYFFKVVHQSNSITHLMETQFNEMVLPLVINTVKQTDCTDKKKFVMDDIEVKINNGLERSLNAAASWVKLYLQTEQKKTDYKPETDDIDTKSSSACRGVIPYISDIIVDIQENLDGVNVGNVLQELGIKLHRVIYDHMVQFQYSMAGAMIAICDINEYRQCTKPLGALVVKLFETLHALSNLLLVKHENLQQVCSEDSLVDLDRSVVDNFIQLRSDFKSQKQLFSRV